MLGAIVSIMMLEPGKSACVNASYCITINLQYRLQQAHRKFDVAVFEMVVVAEFIVPFASRVIVIKSSIFAYEELFVLLLSIVNVSIPSGFASTVTVLITSSGTLPAASGEQNM